MGRLVDGEWVDDGPTLWLDVTCWEGRAERITEQARMGDEILVTGRLTVREHEGARAVEHAHAARRARRLPRLPRGRHGGGRALHLAGAEGGAARAAFGQSAGDAGDAFQVLIQSHR